MKEDAIEVYNGILELFKSTDQHQITVGREEECKQITDFIHNNIDSHKSGFLYICGHPGTGKTSLLNQVLSNIRDDHEEDVLVIKLNAMSFKEFTTLF